MCTDLVVGDMWPSFRLRLTTRDLDLQRQIEPVSYCIATAEVMFQLTTHCTYIMLFVLGNCISPSRHLQAHAWGGGVNMADSVCIPSMLLFAQQDKQETLGIVLSTERHPFSASHSSLFPVIN